MKKAAKKTLIFMILATIVVTAMIGFAGCGDKKLDGLYKEHVIGDAISLGAIKIEGNKIQFLTRESEDEGWSEEYSNLYDETTFTRDGDTIIFDKEIMGCSKMTITKGGNLVGEFLTVGGG